MPDAPDASPIQIQESNVEFYRKAAEAVFANNPGKKDDYAKDPEVYARSAEQKMWELKQQYREFNLELGPIGAGLPPEEIKEGTELHDLVARLSVDFPHWKRLHSIWRMVPDINPYAPSVELPMMDGPSPSSESVESDTITDTMAVNIMELECKRLEAQTAEQPTQRAKYENNTARANVDLELEKLKHQERLLQMQHQREREKKALASSFCLLPLAPGGITCLILAQKGSKRKTRAKISFFIQQMGNQSGSGVSIVVADSVGDGAGSGIDACLFPRALMYYAHKSSGSAWAGEPEFDPTMDHEESDQSEGQEMTPYECLEFAFSVLQDKNIEGGEHLA